MVVSNLLAHFAVYSGLQRTHRHPIMIIDLFVYKHRFVDCEFEYRCGWHALLREKWPIPLYIISGPVYLLLKG